MRVGCFLDTNVLLYAALGRISDPAKFDVSRALIAGWEFGISTQVLGEFFVNAQRKSERPLTADEAAAWLIELEDRPCAPIDLALVERAVHMARRYQIEYWDAAIIAAAERLQAPILYTEDLNHDQIYGSVRVVNPFRSN